MKFAKYALFALMILAVAFSQSNRIIDGHIWNRMKQDNKLYYLTGWVDGLKKAGEIIAIETEVQEKKEFAFHEPFYVYQSKKNMEKYIPPEKFSIPQLAEAIDNFYVNEADRDIPVTVCLRIVLHRFNKETKEADLIQTEARRRLNKD